MLPVCHDPEDSLQNILKITGFNVHVCQTSTCGPVTIYNINATQ